MEEHAENMMKTEKWKLSRKLEKFAEKNDQKNFESAEKFMLKLPAKNF